VLFVHGYAGNQHIWDPLHSALVQAGFDWLIALRYNAFRSDIHQIADQLVDQSHRYLRLSGADRVHLIGHSMGGLVIRDAVQGRGLGGLVDTAITIASPHAGAPLARYMPGRAARQMRPGSDFLTELAGWSIAGRTRWIDIHGSADRVVPQSAGSFGRGAVDQVTVRRVTAGHGSIVRHPAVVAGIVADLQRSEQVAGSVFSLAA
jgi:pimeloyl-ACP methyl ester carboxylesterase